MTNVRSIHSFDVFTLFILLFIMDFPFSILFGVLFVVVDTGDIEGISKLIRYHVVAKNIHC